METICGIEEIGARERKNDFYKIETLDDLCKAIGNVFESDTVNVETVHKLMAAYKSNPLDWRKYAKFDKHK
jgi:cysteine dioxygenase